MAQNGIVVKKHADSWPVCAVTEHIYSNEVFILKLRYDFVCGISQKHTSINERIIRSE